MTFAQLWQKIKDAWHSKPASLIVPVLALAGFWWTHGHDWHTLKSLPTLPEWTAGIMLWTSRFENFSAIFFGNNNANMEQK